MRTTSLSGIGRQKLKRQIGDYRRSEMRCGMCNIFSHDLSFHIAAVIAIAILS